MSNWTDIYKQKLMSVEEAVKLVKSGSTICFGEHVTAPPVFAEAMAKREDLSNVNVYESFPFYPFTYLKMENADRFHPISWFLNAQDRYRFRNGEGDYIHGHLSHHLWINSEFCKYDLYVCEVSPMDENGYFSFSLGTGANRSRMGSAEKVVLEVNPNMPWIGGDSRVHVTEVDGIIEADIPVCELTIPEINEKDREIGRIIADMVPDGACIQLGIGGIPNAVAESLKGKKHLGIHSEMLTENMMGLMESGIVDNSMKQTHKGKSVAAFAIGSRGFYDYCNHNPDVEFYPYEYINDPFVIAKNNNVISINACMEVDLIGQVCSESIGPNQYSGTGGQFDFVYGASRSKGGKSILTMYSTAKNDTVSKIRPMLQEGAVVTTPKNDVDYVVTEYGAVRLRGKTVSERAEALISIAHPKFRSELKEEARKLKYIK